MGTGDLRKILDWPHLHKRATEQQLNSLIDAMPAYKNHFHSFWQTWRGAISDMACPFFLSQNTSRGFALSLLSPQHRALEWELSQLHWISTVKGFRCSARTGERPDDGFLRSHSFHTTTFPTWDMMSSRVLVLNLKMKSKLLDWQ